MLNRRILRVKALQSLYSYHTAKQALRKVIGNKLTAKYELDPAIHDFSDKPFFERRKKLLAEAFEGSLNNTQSEMAELGEEELVDVSSSTDEYNTELAQESSRIRKQMLKEVDDIRNFYIKILLLPGEFVFQESRDKEKLERNPEWKNEQWHFNLIKNPIIEQLSSFEALQKEAIAEKIDWKSESEELKSWYRNILKNDSNFAQYQALENPTIEDHLSILVYLLKKIVFKNSTIESFFIEKDLHWGENKPTLRSLVTKTIKDYDADSEDHFRLMDISKNLEEDLEFFQVIFDETISKDEEMDSIISSKTKNWDLSRVAVIDRIILKMALTEMITFPSIPVKVTINEYIEISKMYSTPKSKQFINGILDVLSNELTSDGVIRKSGRGLIDNK